MKYQETTGKVIGAAMRVHAALGNGFQELIYQRALKIELDEMGIECEREFNMAIWYKYRSIGTRRVDFLIENNICVELKAIVKLEPVHFAQARNYLEAYNKEIGLLINFGSASLEYHRLVNPKYRPTSANEASV